MKNGEADAELTKLEEIIGELFLQHTLEGRDAGHPEALRPGNDRIDHKKNELSRRPP